MIDVLLFAALPYVALVLLVLVSIARYRSSAYTISSLSSQFLETKSLFWGSVPFHLGILWLFVGHLVGFLFPREVMAWNGQPVRLLVLESTALVGGLATLWGLVFLIVRRFTTPRLKPVTSALDYVLYGVLLFQVVTGLWVALGYRWGSAWYVQVAVPYLRSLFVLQPEIKYVVDLPLVVRLHVLGAVTLFLLFAFTRLMHILVAPIPYLWRRAQVVVWHKDRRAVGRARGFGGVR